MAYKHLHEITERDFGRMVAQGFDVVEKLDAIYFKVDFGPHGCAALRSPRFERTVNALDCTLDSTYDDIVRFAEDVLLPHSEDVWKAFGDCMVGFFYLPAHRTRTIEYGSIPEGSFILSDIYCDDKRRKELVNFQEFFADTIPSILPTPTIMHVDASDDIKELIGRYVEGVVSDEEFVMTLIGNNRTYSGLPVSDIEGIIIRGRNFNYKVILNSVGEHQDEYIKSMYRDRIFLDFIHVMKNDIQSREIHSRATNPLESVCQLFAEYMSKTDIFRKDYIEEEDLECPHAGYVGHIGSHYLTSTVNLIIRNSPVYENVLKIILNELLKPHDYVRRGYSEEDIELIANLKSTL